MSREELKKMKVNELAAICKENGIVHYQGKRRFKKDEMIEAILGAKDAENSKSKKYVKVGKACLEGLKEGFESAKDEGKIDNQNVEAESKIENESASICEIDNEQKKAYVENASLGTLVAFKLSSGKAKSAKIVNRNRKKEKLKVETNYGAEYIISYDDIIWVKTGKRWPRGVYNLLKGLDNYESKKEKA